MTITRRNIRRLLYDEVPGLGFSGTADSLSGATLTDTLAFTDSTLATGHYRGMYLLRPDRAVGNDDRVHRIISHNTTTGVVTTTASYSNTGDTNYEVIGLIHPDELDACIKRAVQRIYYELQIVLPGDVTDGDMESSLTSSWTASSGNITLTKTTGSVFSGTYSLRGVNVATAQYAKSVSVRVTGNEPFFLSAVVRAAAGTASLSLYDETSSAIISTASTSSLDQWQNLYVISSIPSSCELVTVRLGGAENNADLYWDHVAFYRTHQTYLVAPSWLDDQHKFLKLRECHYTSAAGTDRNDATSRQFDDWLQPSMFSLDPFPLETNPFQVQLRRHLPNYELWLNGKRPYSDVEPLDNDTDSTHAQDNLVLAYAMDELASVLHRRYPADKRWDILNKEAEDEINAQTASRPETPLQPIRREEWLGYV